MSERCGACERDFAPDYPTWQCSDTTCGMSPAWNENGEKHDDCVNECLHAERNLLREKLQAQTEKANRAEVECAVACGRMRAQKAELRAQLAAATAKLEAADRVIAAGNRLCVAAIHCEEKLALAIDALKAADEMRKFLPDDLTRPLAIHAVDYDAKRAKVTT